MITDGIICITIDQRSSTGMAMWTKITLSCLLILTSHVLYTECYKCTIENRHGSIRKCTKHCCGTLANMYCKKSCDGVKCEKEEGCGGLCCKDGTCQSCGLSKTLIILIAVGVVISVAALTLIVVCYCNKNPSAPRRSGWSELQSSAWINLASFADILWAFIPLELIRTARKQMWIGTRNIFNAWTERKTIVVFINFCYLVTL